MLHERQEFIVHPHSSYLIFATPRSGSYLLCEALISTRVAGHPTEYFGSMQIRSLMEYLDTSSYKQCLDWILNAGTTPNGVFGGKVIWNFHAELVGQLRRVLGNEKLLMPEVLSTTFPNLRYIWITRRDKVRQAISYWKALKTNRWVDIKGQEPSDPMSSNQEVLSEVGLLWSPEMHEVTFDYYGIENLRQYLEEKDVEMQHYFTSCGIQPFKVVYEDFVERYEETALQILDYLHIPVPENLALVKGCALKKQADWQSEEWLQRYYQIKKKKEANREAINTMSENAAQRYIQANVQPPNLDEVNWNARPLQFKLYRNCGQIALSYDTINVGTGVVQGIAAPTGLGRGQIGQMLIDIYGLTRHGHGSVMSYSGLKFLSREERQAWSFSPSLLRPVPSGGALFPCELYLLVGPGQDVSAGIYHYDVAHHALDTVVQGDYSSLLQGALAHPGETPPAYTLLLSCFFWKDGFKYGAFSYRLQGFDIGTIISQSEIITHHAGLSTTIHYQFQDKVLNDLLGLDPLHESVYAVIEWRHREDKANDVGAGLAPALGINDTPALGTINFSDLETNEILSRPTTESIAHWSLPEEVHRASLIETREAFRPLHSLAPIRLLPTSKTIALSVDGPLDLWEARYERHSAVGNFLPTPLTTQQLSRLFLKCMHGTMNDLDGHTKFLQHTMLYCAVCRVQGIPAGIYRYKPERHELELVRDGVSPHQLYQELDIPSLDLFYMSVSLFAVGNYESGIQVYGDRWYRMQNMEAGIIAQRLYLAAAAQNLGCRASLGFGVPEANNLLGLLDVKDGQYTSLLQIMIAPVRSGYQYYERSLLI